MGYADGVLVIVFLTADSRPTTAAVR
jgi:hypothetical protein